MKVTVTEQLTPPEVQYKKLRDQPPGVYFTPHGDGYIVVKPDCNCRYIVIWSKRVILDGCTVRDEPWDSILSTPYKGTVTVTFSNN